MRHLTFLCNLFPFFQKTKSHWWCRGLEISQNTCIKHDRFGVTGLNISCFCIKCKMNIYEYELGLCIVAQVADQVFVDDSLIFSRSTFRGFLWPLKLFLIAGHLPCMAAVSPLLCEFSKLLFQVKVQTFRVLEMRKTQLKSQRLHVCYFQTASLHTLDTMW